MNWRAEVGILGAGTAGARVAELIAGQGVRVVLFDPKAPWEKPCGGGLTPPAFDEIPELEELIPLARVIDCVRVEVSPEAGVWVDLERPMRVVSRKARAPWALDRAARAGATHVAAKVKSLRRSDGGWRLETGEGACHVGFVVGADGAASLVRYALASDVGYGLVSSIVNAFNEHDGNPLRFARRWGRGWRRIRGAPDTDRRRARIPVPCRCGDGPTRAEATEPGRSSATAA